MHWADPSSSSAASLTGEGNRLQLAAATTGIQCNVGEGSECCPTRHDLHLSVLTRLPEAKVLVSRESRSERGRDCAGDPQGSCGALVLSQSQQPKKARVWNEKDWKDELGLENNFSQSWFLSLPAQPPAELHTTPVSRPSSKVPHFEFLSGGSELPEGFHSVLPHLRPELSCSSLLLVIYLLILDSLQHQKNWNVGVGA